MSVRHNESLLAVTLQIINPVLLDANDNLIVINYYNSVAFVSITSHRKRINTI